MSTEHVVGESVVVPGLKLTDHTFQVCCPHVHQTGSQHRGLPGCSTVTTSNAAPVL